MSTQPPVQKLTKKDFSSDQDVRWCPGCGDYAILSTVQKVFPTLGVPKENFVVVSGIGCAARFPYYMNTYGFHSIHGRAPTLATGVKVANPALSVWVISGDGDSLSIGGNHLLHALRRNVNINILMFNNRIYGLTKGQTSPTSEQGKRTKSTPGGAIAQPVNPAAFAIGAGATFIARTVDVQADHLSQMLRRAYEHEGTSFVEIMQNCNIFNDGTWGNLREKKDRADHQLVLEHGRPLRFGADGEKGVRLTGFSPEIVDVDSVDEASLLVHDETAPPAYGMMLAGMGFPEMPTPIGVMRAVKAPVFEKVLAGQTERALSAPTTDLQALVDGPDVWSVH